MNLAEEYIHVHSLALELTISLVIYVINRHVHKLQVFELRQNASKPHINILLWILTMSVLQYNSVTYLSNTRHVNNHTIFLLFIKHKTLQMTFTLWIVKKQYQQMCDYKCESQFLVTHSIPNCSAGKLSGYCPSNAAMVKHHNWYLQLGSLFAPKDMTNEPQNKPFYSQILLKNKWTIIIDLLM